MPWCDKAEMLAILSNHTVTHHYPVAEFSAAQRGLALRGEHALRASRLREPMDGQRDELKGGCEKDSVKRNAEPVPHEVGRRSCTTISPFRTGAWPSEPPDDARDLLRVESG